jgi:hypothetical protein
MIFFKRNNDLIPGTWKGGEVDGVLATALLKCPNGHIASLSDHTIHADGYVEPSVVCPEDGCGFHDMVGLEGWDQFRDQE